MHDKNHWSLAVTATVVCAALGIPAILAAAGVRNWLVLTLGATIAALASASGSVLRERWIRTRLRRDDQSAAIAEGCLGNVDGTLRAVRDFPAPVRLGVHEAEPRPSPGNGPTAEDPGPEYIARDAVDDQLRELLLRPGFVLVTGASASGKTRSAYEAVRAVVPGHRLLAPADRGYLAAALARFEREQRCILWLNDLERFIGANGLTRTAITRVLGSGGHHRLIVATMRNGELERHSPADSGPTGTARQMQRGIREVLEQASKVELRGTFSAAERERARTSADPRIVRALAHADDDGVTQYLAAAPQLLRLWRSGWAHSPRGAALVAAAVDCRRAGLTGALPGALLEKLHEIYLERHQGEYLRPEPLDAAWEWATIPPDGTVALLRETGTARYSVFDYLIDSAQHHVTADDLIPSSVLTAALGYASPAEAQAIGWTAQAQARYDIALRAFDRALDELSSLKGADHPDILRIRADLAYAKCAQAHFSEAMSEFQSVIAACERRLGRLDPLTLAARVMYGEALGGLDEYTAAATAFRDVLALLDENDELALEARKELAFVLTETGQLQQADAEFRKVITAAAQRHGPDHIITLAARCYRARTLEKMDRLDEAQAEQENALAALRVVWGDDHYVTLQSQSNLAEVLRKRDRLDEAIALYVQVLATRNRVLGTGHIATLGVQTELGSALAEAGRLDDGLAHLRDAAQAYARNYGEQYPETRWSRLQFARALQKAGRAEEAKEQERIIREATAIPGPRDPGESSAQPCGCR